MKLKILIAEDEPDQYEVSKSTCTRLALDQGFIIRTDSFEWAKTLSDIDNILSRNPFIFDIIIFDIGFGDEHLDTKKITEYLKNDLLSESKVIIRSGNADFFLEPDSILSAIHGGVKAIAAKGNTDGISGFEHQFSRILREIKLETVWANIGRLSPQWKRELFHDEKLWKNLNTGFNDNKVIVLIDISHSTKFVKTQISSARNPQHILKLFNMFAYVTTTILEKDEYQGIIERYSGDEVMAYFSIKKDKTIKDACCRAIRASVEIRDEFNKAYDQLQNLYKYEKVVDSGGAPLKPRLRILIHWGQVMWVLQGSEARKQLSIMTEVVAKAYRGFTSRNGAGLRHVIPDNIFISHEVFNEVKENGILVDYETNIDCNELGTMNAYQLKIL